MTKELLIKFLENRCSSDELEQVINWINKNALSKKSKYWAYDDWLSFDEKSFSSNPMYQKERFDLMLDKIHHKMNINRPDESKNKRFRTSSKIMNWITKAAAILLIPVLSLLFYTLYTNSIHVVKYVDTAVDSLEIVALEARSVVKLCDGTVVHLNTGSKLNYPKNFNESTRNVSLSGEGFFEVAHNPERPFIVKTKQMDVKALGTKFNVMSYPDNDVVMTTLVEGKVVLGKENKDGKMKVVESMTPGQHVEYNVKSGDIFCVKGNIDKYIAWKDGLFIFDNSYIEEVAEKLSRKFNVEIEVAKEIKDYTYTAKFTDESLTQVLDILVKTTPVDYIIIPRKNLPDGTYSKQKIMLKKRQK